MVKDKDKVKGALYGVAVGDALGAPAEMMDRDELVEKFGKLRCCRAAGSIVMRASRRMIRR